MEKRLRGGGTSYIAKRYAKANNKYMNDHDSKKLAKFITYLDMKYLYGWGLIDYLPYDGFNWLKNVDGIDLNSVGERVQHGIYLMLTLNVLTNYMNLRNDYQLFQKNVLFLVIYC